MSKYKDLPKQRFDIYYYSVSKAQRRLTAKQRWQLRYRVGRAKGVWVRWGTVIARSPWEACAKAKVKAGIRKSLYHKWRAMPTWKEE